MLVASAITKRFGTILALDQVNFRAHPGEIHVLLGENGAGKTTLMNVIGGRLRPDAGEVSLEQCRLRPGDTRQALAAGIAAVSQSPLLFERLSWEENLALGGFRMRSLDEVAARARQLADRLGFKLPPPRATLENRSMSERVRLEILRALSLDPRVLILDEPTALLGPAELDGFLELLGRLRADRRIVILITHKLAEALAAADRITVLRQGRVVFNTTPADTSREELARVMLGEMEEPPSAAPAPLAGIDTLLELDRLTLRFKSLTVLDQITLSVRAGDILGIAGVDGNGQTELIEVIAGVRPTSEGTIQVGGRMLGRDTGSIAVIPQDRDQDGLILDMELWENLLLAGMLRRRFTIPPLGLIARAPALEFADQLLARFKIRASGPRARLATLSGGNRQRLELARALESGSRVIVAHNLTRGLDPSAAADIHRRLGQFAAAGNCVMLISSDLDELLSLCDRLAVISRGQVREVGDQERNPERLGLLMSGAVP